MTEPKNRMSEIMQREQLSLLFLQAPQTVFSAMAVSIVVVIILWHQLATTWLLTWFFLLQTTSLSRILLIRRYRRNDKQHSGTYWLRRYTWITLAAGLCWGIGCSLFLQQLDLPLQMFIVAILAGVSAGAITTYAASSEVYRVFLLSSLPLPALLMVLQADFTQRGMGLLMVLFTFLMAAQNNRLSRSYNENVRLRFKNSHLFEQLESEVAERRHNEELLRDSEETLKLQRQQLESLLRLTRRLERTDSHAQVAEAIGNEIEQAFGVKHTWIYLMSDDPDIWQLLPTYNEGSLDLASGLPEIYFRGDAMLEEIAAASHPVVILDARTDLRTNKESVAKLGNRSIVNVPMTLSGKKIGALGMGTFDNEGTRTFNESELNHLAAMASHVALAIDRIRLFNEQLEVQTQLQHSQRLDSLGLLAGGIAHDFNNILTSILGGASVAVNRLDQSPDIARNQLLRIVEASKRAADLCNQMLAYSGKGKFVVEMIDLNEYVHSMVPLLEASIGKHVEVEYQLTDSLPPVEVDIAQVQQVIMNLVINASESISAKQGHVQIMTGLMQAEATYLSQCQSNSAIPGAYLFLEVRDNGCGMDEETANRIFDPFFTTKFTGRGLGMSAILGIVNGHQGAIHMNSIPDQGTTFRVLLPTKEICLLEDDAQHTIDEGTIDGKNFGPILVVEDEPSVQELACMILAEEDFNVLTADNGEEAVVVYSMHQNDISLVLMDLTMPKMNGLECFREMRRLNPEVKVILVSGYSEEDSVSQFEESSLAGFIKKPYMPEELLSHIKLALEQA